MENPTRHKVREAEYFLGQMKQTFENADEFYWNLSAFFSAARSITFYMQEQYAHQDGFTEWYCQEQIKMKADLELSYLNKARVEAVHTEPVQTGVSCKVTTGGSACIVGNGILEDVEQAEEAKSKPPAQASPQTVRRFLPKFGDVDVMKYCVNQLTKLVKIVKECENRFLGFPPRTG